MKSGTMESRGVAVDEPKPAAKPNELSKASQLWGHLCRVESLKQQLRDILLELTETEHKVGDLVGWDPGTEQQIQFAWGDKMVKVQGGGNHAPHVNFSPLPTYVSIVEQAQTVET